MTNSSLGWDSILEAIQLATAEAQRLGVEPHHLAERKRTESAIAGDYTYARIWRDVWICFMTQKYLPATLRIHEPTIPEQIRLQDRTKH